MKYYAVTDDPNELMHFGIKGMKWGVIRSPEQLGHHKSTKSRSTSKKSSSAKTKSPAYIRASDKLRKMMSSGIEKAKADWKAYNSPAQKAVRQYKKGERLFEKHVQLARQGRLKYKGISDDEVVRINNRLYLENQARNQSGREKASFVRRLSDSYKEGVIEGVGRGASSYINERMMGRGRTTAKIKDEKRMARFHNSLAGRLTQNREDRAADRKAKREAIREVDKEYYKYAAEQGEPTGGIRALARSVSLSNYSAGGAYVPQITPHSSLSRSGRAAAVRNYKDAEYRTKLEHLAAESKAKNSGKKKDKKSEEESDSDKKSKNLESGNNDITSSAPRLISGKTYRRLTNRSSISANSKARMAQQHQAAIDSYDRAMKQQATQLTVRDVAQQAIARYRAERQAAARAARTRKNAMRQLNRRTGR